MPIQKKSGNLLKAPRNLETNYNIYFKDSDMLVYIWEKNTGKLRNQVSFQTVKL